MKITVLGDIMCEIPVLRAGKMKDGSYNFECIEAIDLELLNNHLTKLLNGEEVEIPEFDFKVGTKKA